MSEDRTMPAEQKERAQASGEPQQYVEALALSVDPAWRRLDPRERAADAVAFVEALGTVRPGVPKLLVWDNAPPRHPGLVKEAARAAGVELAFLPFRSPELMTLEDLWRGLKGEVAADRRYAAMEELAERATAWLDGMTGAERRRRCGLESSKFAWLPT